MPTTVQNDSPVNSVIKRSYFHAPKNLRVAESRAVSALQQKIKYIIVSGWYFYI